MKSYTDIEQSYKLAKILPIESADMHYKVDRFNNKPEIYVIPYSELGVFKDNDVQYCVPCWSLAALLDVLKDNIKIEKTLFDQSDMFTYSIIGDSYDYRTYEHENLIDACVEMILKLNERNLL